MEQSIANLGLKSFEVKAKINVVRDALWGFLMSLTVGLFSALLLVILVIAISNSVRADTR